MTTRVEEVKARFAEALAKAEREDEALAILPEDLQENAFVVAQRGEMWFILRRAGYGFERARSIHEAADIFERLRAEYGDLVTCKRWRDGSLRTTPSAAPTENAELVGKHQLYLDISGGQGFGPDVELIGYFNTNIGRIRVAVPINDLNRLLPCITRDRSGRWSIYRNSHAGDATTKWASGSDTSYHYNDWFETWESFQGWLETAAPLAREA